MKQIYFFKLNDCNVSKLFESRLEEAIQYKDLVDKFNIIKYNLYSEEGKIAARKFAVYDAPCLVFPTKGVMKTVPTTYALRQWLRAGL